MIRHQIGVAGEVKPGRLVSEVEVIVEGRVERALNYNFLTGPVGRGDRLLLNTTAVHLELGSGGYHFVEFNFSRPLPPFQGRGHIMKLCYTPWQMRVLSCEEQAAGNRARLARFAGLGGTPVLIGELHSMVAPAAAVLKYYRPACRIAYVMTDATALPLPFSRTVARLKEKGLLSATISCGHAFGGDYEAVNVYSALAACRSLIGADFIILAPGPGSIGTASRLGFSGMEAGDNVNRVNALGGTPLFIPRISFAERRRRHFGLSHHSLTALAVAALSPALLVLPLMPPQRLRLCLGQLAAGKLISRHRLLLLPPPPLEAIVRQMELGPLESMGRSFREDPCFFEAAAAAAAAALRLAEQKERVRRNGEGEKDVGGKRAFDHLSLPGPDHQPPPGPGSPSRRRRAFFPGNSGASRGGSHPGAGSERARAPGQAVPPRCGQGPAGGAGRQAGAGGGAAGLRPKGAGRGDRLPGGKVEKADLVLQHPGLLR